eukprot:419938_1
MVYTIYMITSLIHAMNSAGFEYPETMPDPINAQNAFIMTLVPFLNTYETPILIRMTSALDSTVWNCLATYHDTAFDILTKKRPLVPADSTTITTYGSSQTRMLCGAYAVAIVSSNIELMPETTDAMISLLNAFGLTDATNTIDTNVAACGVTDSECLQDVAAENNYEPNIMASIVAYQVIDYLSNDGWNSDGSIGCTANCRRYSDTTNPPYAPDLNAPYSWKPLTEDNGKGFFYEYGHVVPHIGYTVTPKVLTLDDFVSRSAPDPDYDYEEEVELVIERLRNLATDDRQKMLVEFFDDKISVVLAIILQLDMKLNWTWEQRQIFIVGFSSVEYDAVLQSWREKRKWDLVRPTTLIKNGPENGLTEDTITTYGGPYQGVQTIDAEDFEAYIRVMPHSEYPSASGCICLVAAEFTNTLLNEQWDMDTCSIDLPFPGAAFAAGSSKIEPDQTPDELVFATMSSLMELSDTCGESRLWGGMHFTKSIHGSHELCDGIGVTGYKFINAIYEGTYVEPTNNGGNNINININGDDDDDDDDSDSDDDWYSGVFRILN